MNFPCFRAISLSFVSFLATAVCAVAQQLPENDDDIPVEFIPRLENTVSIGFSRLSSGPRVRFGNLGMIKAAATQSPAMEGSVTRFYSNGSVAQDALGTYEKDLSGTPLTAPFSQFATPEWISKVTAPGVITVYQPIAIAQTDASGNLIQNPQDLNYVAVTTPIDNNTPGGVGNTLATQSLFWAATSRFFAYNENQTRSWKVENSSQINLTNHTVAMSTYGTTSAGASVEADSSASSGFELSLEHRLGQRGRFEWGVSAGIKLVGINAKANAAIPAYLTNTTDTYRMIPLSYNSDGTPVYASAVSIDPSLDAIRLNLHAYDPSTTSDSGALLLDQFGFAARRYSSATTEPLSYTPLADRTGSTSLSVASSSVLWGTEQQDGRIVNVHGNYQLKGAYYMMRVGPTFRYRFNDTFSVSGSFGIVQGYVGTTYKAEEYFDDTLDVYTAAGVLKPIPDDVSKAKVYRSKEENMTHKFVPGVYGEVNVEYWVTERTGFYFGMTKQAMREYSQTPLSGRTAKIDMGSSSGWKLGVMTRF